MNEMTSPTSPSPPGRQVATLASAAARYDGNQWRYYPPMSGQHAQPSGRVQYGQNPVTIAPPPPATSWLPRSAGPRSSRTAAGSCNTHRIPRRIRRCIRCRNRTRPARGHARSPVRAGFAIARPAVPTAHPGQQRRHHLVVGAVNRRAPMLRQAADGDLEVTGGSRTRHERSPGHSFTRASSPVLPPEDRVSLHLADRRVPYYLLLTCWRGDRVTASHDSCARWSTRATATNDCDSPQSREAVRT